MKERGFFIIELMIVIIIIGIFCTAAIPQTNSARHLALENEAWHLANDLQWLRQRSINMAKGHNLVTAAGYEQRLKIRFIAGQNSRYTIAKGTVIIKQHIFSNNVYITGNIAEISFNTDGHINQMQSITLFQGQRSRQVVINITGRIRVE